MLDLVADVGSSDVVVKALGVVANHHLPLTLALVLPLYELLLNVVVTEGLHERTELLLLVVAGRTTRVHENRGTQHRRQDLGLLELPLVNVDHDEKVEIDALVVVGGRGELDCREVDLAVDHLHLALASDAHVEQSHPVCFVVLGVTLHSEYLGLSRVQSTYRFRGERRKSPVVSSLI